MKTNIKAPKMVWWTGIVEDFIVRHMKPEREGEILKTSKEARTGSG